MNCKIPWDGPNVILKFYGHINFKDVFDANNNMYGDPKF